MTDVITRKKLIEVALPLDAINAASAREKSIRRGHPSTLHLWWARRPLAAARAVIFAQMVDDPSEYLDELKGDPKLKRKAEGILEARHKQWMDATSKLEEARDDNVDAPEPGPEPTLDDILAEIERDRLFNLIARRVPTGKLDRGGQPEYRIDGIVAWPGNDATLRAAWERDLQTAREEIWQSWRRTCADNAGHPRAKELFDCSKLPAFYDPFAGGGALPLEAQRLGLEAYASDLNPVAVLINKAMIEIPPKFAGRPPVNPESRKGQLGTKTWRGAQGLAEDVRYYGQWMRDEAEKRIGHLYPKIEITAAMAQERPDLKPLVGRQLTVIAWLWARTVKSPNPAFREVDVPLASTFMLSTKPGKEAWVEPVIEKHGYRFTVQVGQPKDAEAAKAGTKLARGANFRCVMSGTPIAGDYIMAEGKERRIGSRLMAVVALGDRGRVFLSPTRAHEKAACDANPGWSPEVDFFQKALGFRIGNYGLSQWSHLFSRRQSESLATLSDLVVGATERICRDAAGLFTDDDRELSDGGIGARAYAQAVSIYLTFAVCRQAVAGNMLVTWNSTAQKAQRALGRQDLHMVWDYCETNPFGGATGAWEASIELEYDPLQYLGSNLAGSAVSLDATAQTLGADKIVSTDPPYYDNIGYADLSDFFYVWQRKALKGVFPELFSTLATPKDGELVATPARHGGKKDAETFFLSGMTKAMHRLVTQSHPAFPTTVYYAFKQAETQSEVGTASTGWETFLDATIRVGFGIVGTLPVRTEMTTWMKGEKNALASSIVLVCRPRAADAPTATRREFLAALQAELPGALRVLQAGNIAPVDLAQAAIGPGMAVFTRYARVLDAQAKALTVREALALINETLDTALAEQEGDFDADSRWALAWFEQAGFESGAYGVAEVLATAKVTSVAGMVEAGIAESKGGKVRLKRPKELADDWDPQTDSRLTVWETVHHLIRALEIGGESAAAVLVAKLGVHAETARELAYRLYTLCERKKRAQEALSYNSLVQSWPEIERLAHSSSSSSTDSGVLPFSDEQE